MNELTNSFDIRDINDVEGLNKIIEGAVSVINKAIEETAKAYRDVENTRSICKAKVQMDKEHCQMVMRALQMIDEELLRRSNITLKAQEAIRDMARELINKSYLNGIEPSKDIIELIHFLIIESMKCPEYPTEIDAEMVLEKISNNSKLPLLD